MAKIIKALQDRIREALRRAALKPVPWGLVPIGDNATPAATPGAVRAAGAIAALPPVGRLPARTGAGRAQVPQVRVWIGERELTDIVRVEIDGAIDEADAALARQLYTRGVG